MQWLHNLIEQYGLYAVFLGCVAEGESAAILAGFFSHQNLFQPWQAFVAASVGAFTGDTLFFLAGRRFANHPTVANLRQRPGFSHAFSMVTAHPNIFVLTNRFIYGLRLVGGVAAGMANIPAWRFVMLNAISSLIWAGTFTSLGYFFGIGAEAIIGRALEHHHRLMIGLALALLAAIGGWLLATHFARREGRSEQDLPNSSEPDRTSNEGSQ